MWEELPQSHLRKPRFLSEKGRFPVQGCRCTLPVTGKLGPHWGPRRGGPWLWGCGPGTDPDWAPASLCVPVASLDLSGPSSVGKSQTLGMAARPSPSLCHPLPSPAYSPASLCPLALGSSARLEKARQLPEVPTHLLTTEVCEPRCESRKREKETILLEESFHTFPHAGRTRRGVDTLADQLISLH